MRGQYSNQVFFEPQQAGYAIFELEHGAVPNPDHGSKLGKVAFSNVVAHKVARGWELTMHIRENATARKFDLLSRQVFAQVLGPKRITGSPRVIDVRQRATTQTSVAATAGQPDLFTASARVVTN
jgi:hypothetical protein